MWSCGVISGATFNIEKTIKYTETFIFMTLYSLTVKMFKINLKKKLCLAYIDSSDSTELVLEN